MDNAKLLGLLGVPDHPPRTVPFDPGYDPGTVAGHLAQSGHLMAMLKLSMACWIIAADSSTTKKLEAAASCHVQVVTGGGPFEIAAAQGCLEEYLDLCAEIGVARVEAAEGFTKMPLMPEEVVAMTAARGLRVQFELGEKHGGFFGDRVTGELIETGRKWVGAGADQLVVEARESAVDVGLFGSGGALDRRCADRFAEAFGLDRLVFEAPTKASQFALLSHFGPEVVLGNVRLEELLRVEIYRRGIHSDAFEQERLRPDVPWAAR